MIGIFDSGIGGLTVVKEILKQLPEYQIIYFGDTARTPYGNKSKETIIKYAFQDTEFLLKKGARIIIVACNTASAVAADELKKQYPNIPIFEVITPAVAAATAATKNKRIGVIGTRATVNSHIYESKIKAMTQRPWLSRRGVSASPENGYKIFSRSCPLFVPLAEEGWIDKPVTKIIARKYLYSLKMEHIDTLILGCTHYPLLKDVIQIKIGKRVKLIDPAELTAEQVKKYLAENPGLEKNMAKNNNHKFYFSDLAPHLTGLMHLWLGQKIRPELYNME